MPCFLPAALPVLRFLPSARSTMPVTCPVGACQAAARARWPDVVAKALRRLKSAAGHHRPRKMAPRAREPPPKRRNRCNQVAQLSKGRTDGTLVTGLCRIRLAGSTHRGSACQAVPVARAASLRCSCLWTFRHGVCAVV